MKKKHKTNAQGRRCSGAVKVSPHKNRRPLLRSQGNVHAQREGPQNRVTLSKRTAMGLWSYFRDQAR